ncbi:hypothetical protein D3C75_964570 [compost metagenome]
MAHRHRLGQNVRHCLSRKGNAVIALVRSCKRNIADRHGFTRPYSRTIRKDCRGLAHIYRDGVSAHYTACNGYGVHPGGQSAVILLISHRYFPQSERLPGYIGGCRHCLVQGVIFRIRPGQGIAADRHRLGNPGSLVGERGVGCGRQLHCVAAGNSA